MNVNRKDGYVELKLDDQDLELGIQAKLRFNCLQIFI